jgi:hypothetical protein
MNLHRIEVSYVCRRGLHTSAQKLVEVAAGLGLIPVALEVQTTHIFCLSIFPTLHCTPPPPSPSSALSPAPRTSTPVPHSTLLLLLLLPLYIPSATRYPNNHPYIGAYPRSRYHIRPKRLYNPHICCSTYACPCFHVRRVLVYQVYLSVNLSNHPEQ